jgi:hypothetical protein
MAKETAKTKDKCGCMPCMGFLALILGVIGIYSIILGIKTQWASMLTYSNWMAMIYYLVGVLAMAMAKLSKHHAYDKCDMHRLN